MAPIIAPGVCRFTLNGSFTGGNQIDNVLDMQIDTTGSVISRGDAIFNQAGILINEWVAEIIPVMVANYTLNSVSWVDLNSESGTTGSRTSSGAINLPRPGLAAGSSMSSNVAMLAKKGIVGTRNRRNGRMYLPPPTEANTNGNIIVPAFVTNMNTRLAAFLGDINQTDPEFGDFGSTLVVVHTTTNPPADPVFNGFTPVETLTLDSLLATQRRRLRD